MAYTRQYKAFLRPERRVPRSQIRPRNIYRITTYRGGDPITKSGEDARYVFVIGIITGTFSSIFIASPIFYFWHKGDRKHVEEGEILPKYDWQTSTSK